MPGKSARAGGGSQRRTAPLRHRPRGAKRGSIERAAPSEFPRSWLCLLQTRALTLRHVLQRRVLADLKRADIGYDRPAVAGLDLHGIARHRPKAVRHHVEEMARRSI